MQSVVCLLVVAFSAAVHGGNVCTDISQCQPGECCQILSQRMIVSKRDLVTGFLPQREMTGTCEPYTREGGNCPMFGRANGYCSCEPGTTCRSFQVPLVTRSRAMRKIAAPRPGYKWERRCTRQ